MKKTGSTGSTACTEYFAEINHMPTLKEVVDKSKELGIQFGTSEEFWNLYDKIYYNWKLKQRQRINPETGI